MPRAGCLEPGPRWIDLSGIKSTELRPSLAVYLAGFAAPGIRPPAGPCAFAFAAGRRDAGWAYRCRCLAVRRHQRLCFGARAPVRANANVPSGLKSWMTTEIPEHPYVATKTILFERQTGMRDALFMSLDRLAGWGGPKTLLERIVGAGR